MDERHTPVTVVIAARPGVGQPARDAVAAAGFAVAAECTDTAAALAAVERLHPDVCVLDRGLPGGGLAAIAAFSTPGRRPRVIVIGGESPAEIRAARLAGADDCVPQAASADVIAASLETAAHRTRRTSK
jgi:two-component system response regulator DesR